MSEEDTFIKLRRPDINGMRDLVKIEAHRMKSEGIVFGSGWWDCETLRIFLAKHYWTLNEYRNEVN